VLKIKTLVPFITNRQLV